MKKWLSIFVAIVVLVTGLMILFSPYGKHDGFAYKLVKESVVIEAPVNSVFTFLGNSNNATRWSVFVDHITTLNADKFRDGQPGSIRRCFCKKDETGTQWDELISENVPRKKRQLTIFNLVDFPLTAKGLATEQLYDSLGENKCRLSFTIFFKKENPTLADQLKMYIAAYQMKDVLVRNMANIKKLTEHE